MQAYARMQGLWERLPAGNSLRHWARCVGSPLRGRPRIKPWLACGGKGYGSRRIQAWLRRRGIHHAIPRKTNERRTGHFHRSLYRQRNLVEQTINRLKQFRRIATRYEKRPENYPAMLQIGALLLWL